MDIGLGQMQKEKLEETFKEILTDQISGFSYEESKGMNIKFIHGDKSTELTFGDLEIHLDGNFKKIDNKKS